MIDPIALVVLKNNAVVTTPDGDTEAEQVAVHEFSRSDARNLRVRTSIGDVYIRRVDIDHVVDLRTDEYRPRELEYIVD
ncbi:hypothetical protein SAMN05216388_10133 [Halorientalis persicus]|uniref:Uncharacterized protein n=1 Tax=Halorientalis persicus TaxID=1367881 RepID=A0A1H8PZ31_9EURY|nr:hypothetical protein [Halorientalis persicus]SEO47011.1 hypothetical protein SAMN05216388_10133 [Halorientalis persicus]